MKTCDNCHEHRPTVKYSFYPMRLCVDCLGELILSSLERLERSQETFTDYSIPKLALYAYEEARASEEWN